MTHLSTGITEIGTVFVPVSDQERALAFYVDVLGFEKRVDFGYGGGSRWIEVAPIGATNTLALVPPSEGSAVPTDAARCALATTDIDADRAALQAAGVEVSEIAGSGSSRRGLLERTATIADPVPRQLLFLDPEGNRFLIVQAG